MEKFRGAEAEVKINGEVEKTRKPKAYRNPELDTRIRKDRTETEADIMEKARRKGANVPKVLEKDENSLKIQKIEGEQLKQRIEEETELARNLGNNVAKLHSADIIHGDLTTSNAMVSDRLYLIDFGLSYRSERIEDRAVDIHLFKQVLESSHPEVAEKAWQKFVSGYSKYRKSGEVMERLEEVEQRGRYK